MVTVAVYVVPAGMPVVFTVNVSVEEEEAGSFPLLVSTLSHDCDGVPLLHVKVLPPVLVSVMDCGAGFCPVVVVKERPSVLSCMAGCETLMVIAIVAELPVTGFPVFASVALTVALVLNVEPPARPVASTVTLSEVEVPPARFMPEPVESETKPGAPVSRVALQFRDAPPVFEIVMACDVTPVVTLKVSEPGPALNAGGACTLSNTLTICGLPVIAIPLFTAASESEPL